MVIHLKSEFLEVVTTCIFLLVQLKNLEFDLQKCCELSGAIEFMVILC